jgi:hypothetical protein
MPEPKAPVVAPKATAAPAAAPAPVAQPAPVVEREIPSFTDGVAPAKSEQQPAESTAAASPGEESPVTESPEIEKPEKPGKSRFERRIDRVNREKAQERARADAAERVAQELRQKYEQPQRTIPAPRLEDFTDIQQYAEAHAEWKMQTAKAADTERSNRENGVRQAQQLADAWESKLDRAYRKYDDFDEKVGDIKPTTPWAVALMLADNGDDVAYHLGSNVAEAKRIHALPPALQFIEIGKLAATLAAKPQEPKKPSAAPAPIAPVGGSQATSNVPADTDDIKTWMAKENARMAKRA